MLWAAESTIAICRRFAPSSAMRRADNYRVSDVIMGIVRSTPFQMRMATDKK